MTALCVIEMNNMSKVFSAPEQLKTSTKNKSCKLLHVVHHNKQLAAAGRTTTIYHLANDKDEAESNKAASYFLLPDPYAGIAHQEEYTFIMECGSTDADLLSELFKINDTGLTENKSYSGINNGMYKVL